MKKYRVVVIGRGAILFSSHAYPLHKLEQLEVKVVCDIKSKMSSTY
jgi:predicted dehydrogenase